MISLLTALIIQNRKVLCEAGGPCTKGKPHEIGKWLGWIIIDEDSWYPLINTPPIYDTKQQAEQEMKALVDKIKTTNLNNDVEQLRVIIGEAGPVISKVITASQGKQN